MSNNDDDDARQPVQRQANVRQMLLAAKRNTRKRLTLAEKATLVAELRDSTRELTNEGLAAKYGIGIRTLHRVRKQADKICALADQAGARKTVGSGRSAKPVLERKLLDWITHARSVKRGLPVSRNALCVQAWRLRNALL